MSFLGAPRASEGIAFIPLAQRMSFFKSRQSSHISNSPVRTERQAMEDKRNAWMRPLDIVCQSGDGGKQSLSGEGQDWDDGVDISFSVGVFSCRAFKPAGSAAMEHSVETMLTKECDSQFKKRNDPEQEGIYFLFQTYSINGLKIKVKYMISFKNQKSPLNSPEFMAHQSKTMYFMSECAAFINFYHIEDADSFEEAKTWQECLSKLRKLPFRENDPPESYYLIGLRSMHEVSETSKAIRNKLDKRGSSTGVDGIQSSNAGKAASSMSKSPSRNGSFYGRQNSSSGGISNPAGPGDRHSEGNVTGVRRGSILRSLIENTEMMESTIELVEDDTFRQVSVDEILHLAKEAKCQFMEMNFSYLDRPLSPIIKDIVAGMPSKEMLQDHPSSAVTFHIKIHRIASLEKQKPFFQISPTKPKAADPDLPRIEEPNKGMFNKWFTVKKTFAPKVSPALVNVLKQVDKQKAYLKSYEERFSKETMVTDVCDWL